MSSFLTLLLTTVTFSLSVASVNSYDLKKCNFKAIYNLGDSLSDTGNVPIEFPGTTVGHLPYGMTINRATGRSSDGYILLDRIAEAAGVPYVNPYLNKSLDHTYGANFAVGGVGYLSKETRNKWDIHLPWSQSSVDVQMDWLEQHLNHTFPDAASRREHLKSSLFLVGGGGNDYGSFRLYAANRSPLEQKRIIMPDVFDAVRAYLRKLIINYEIENIVVTGLYEGGCLVNWKFNDNQTHCHNDTNAYHILHNQILQQELQLLREVYPSVHLAYGDVWNAHQWLLDNYWSIGYRYPNYLGCCGNATIGCGYPGSPFCKNPNEYMYFDTYHFTDFSYRLMAKMVIPEIAAALECE